MCFFSLFWGRRFLLNLWPFLFFLVVEVLVGKSGCFGFVRFPKRHKNILNEMQRNTHHFVCEVSFLPSFSPSLGASSFRLRGSPFPALNGWGGWKQQPEAAPDESATKDLCRWGWLYVCWKITKAGAQKESILYSLPTTFFFRGYVCFTEGNNCVILYESRCVV